MVMSTSLPYDKTLLKSNNQGSGGSSGLAERLLMPQAKVAGPRELSLFSQTRKFIDRCL